MKIPIKFDRTSLFLLLVNLAAIYFAVVNNWSFNILIWVYWLQSIIIGIFTLAKLKAMRKYFAMAFFTMHYGLFHLAYFFFLQQNAAFEFTQAALILTALFFVNHLLSFHFYGKREALRSIDEGPVMGQAYFRIIPIHLIIVIGSFGSSTLGTMILFILLKTCADLFAHYHKHA